MQQCTVTSKTGFPSFHRVEEHVRATVTPDALSAGLEYESAMQFMRAVDANRRDTKTITLDPRKRVLQLFTWATSKFYSVQNAQTAITMGWLLDNIAGLVISHGYCNVTLCWAQVLVHINMWSLPNRTRKICCLTDVIVNCLPNMWLWNVAVDLWQRISGGTVSAKHFLSIVRG